MIGVSRSGGARHLLPLVVLLTGASVLNLEVLAVRVLSPYYGNTIYTVSSVISIILLGLSAGYYAGGALADRRPSLHWFFGIIAVSGLLLVFFYFLGTMILPALGDALSIESGPLVSAALLFLLPALLLGTLCPFAIKLQSINFPEQGVGRIAGTIFFWSTLGSISGSLLSAFVLIPHFGIDRILIANGVLLFVLGFVPLVVLGARKRRLATALVAFILLLAAPRFAAQPEGRAIVYRKDGLYQRITIYDGAYFGRPARFLLLDRSESGAMFLDSNDPADLVYDYTKYYALHRIFAPRVERALVLGGGAYSIPKALLRELPNATVDVAEIEPSFFGLAKRYFGAADDPRLHNYVQDGRRFLHDSDRRYDLIFGDVYYSYFSVPPHFTTKEFFALAKDRLSADGVFIANMIGDLSRQQPSLILAEIKTFQTVFPNSYFFAVDSPEKVDLIQNITLVGYNGTRHMDVGSPSVTMHRDPIIRYLRNKVVDVNRRFELSPYPVLTDTFSPVEYLTAQALRRSSSGSIDLNGREMLAVIDQELRYGPRHAGAPGHRKLQDFLFAEMAVLAGQVITQKWTQARSDGKPDELTNIVGRFFPDEQRRVVLATHYNRSASGAALLVELARGLISSPVVRRVGVDIVFLDGVHGQERLKDLGGDPPVSTVVLDEICEDEPVFDTCSAERLETAAQAVLTTLNRTQ